MTRADERATGSRPRSTLGVLATLRRGVQVSPQLLVGLAVTVAARRRRGGRARRSCPIAVQQTVDTGILAAGGPDMQRVVGARRRWPRSGC